MKTKEPKSEDWARFVREGLKTWTDESPSNVAYVFTKMTKLFGLCYIYWLELQYLSCVIESYDQGAALDEVCQFNGDVPKAFFDKFK